MRIRKTLFFILIASLCLSILAINLKVVSSYLITPERIKDIIFSSLGVKSEMDQVTFNLWRGLKVSNLSLSAQPQAKNESSFLTIKRIEIIADKSELLRGNFIAGEIILKQPKLNWDPSIISMCINNLATPAINSSAFAPQHKSMLIQTLSGKTQPRITIKDGSIHILEKGLIQENNSIALKDLDIFLYPVSFHRYIIEGQTKLEISSLTGQPFVSGCKITGEFNTQSNFIQLRFNLAGISIDKTLLNKLCKKYQDIWQIYQFKGPVNLGINYSYNFESQTTDFGVEVDCLGNDITYIHFPYAFSGVKGQIVFSKTGVLLKKLSSVDPLTNSTYFLDGNISGYEQATAFEIILNATNLPLDNKLSKSLPASFRNIWNKLQLAGGRIDFNSLIRRKPGHSKNIEYNLGVSCKNIVSTPAYFPYPLNEINGDLEVTIKTGSSTEIKIKSLDASNQTSAGLTSKSKIRLSGFLNIMPEETFFNLAIEAKNIQTNDYALKEAAKRYVVDAEKLWATYQPEGLINTTALLSKTDKNKEIDVQLSVECNNTSIKLGPSYYSLNSLQGRIEYISNFVPNRAASDYASNMFTGANTQDNDLFSDIIFNRAPNQGAYPAIFLRHVRASNDKAIFNFDGVIFNPFSAPIFTLSVKTSKLNLNNQFFGLLPGQTGAFLKDIEFNGSGDLSVKIANSGLNPGAINYHTEIKLSDGQLKAGVILNEINGTVILKGQYQDGTKNGNTAGTIQLNSLRLSGKQISNVSVQFLRENNRFNFYDISGSSYEGSISGYVVVLLPSKASNEKYQYYGKLNLIGLDLRAAARDSTLININLSGKLTAELVIKGQGVAKEEIYLEGKASVIDAQLWEVPVFLSILNLFASTDKSAFHEGEIRFQLKRGRINVNRLILISKSVTLRGKGAIELDGSLDLRFDTEFAPWFLPNIKLLKDITELFKTGIYTIKIEGTFAKPKAMLKPLPILDIFK